MSDIDYSNGLKSLSGHPALDHGQSDFLHDASEVFADLVVALEAAEEYISVDTDIPAADAVLAQIRIALAKAKSRDSRCPHCLGVCNPLHDGSGFCDKCQGTGHAKTKED